MIVKTADILNLELEYIQGTDLRNLYPYLKKLKLFRAIGRELDISGRAVSYIILGKRPTSEYKEEVDKVSREKIIEFQITEKASSKENNANI